jgi:hypothetical protein
MPGANGRQRCPGFLRNLCPSGFKGQQKIHFLSAANPTIASYNASVVNFYNATGSPARFES